MTSSNGFVEGSMDRPNIPPGTRVLAAVINHDGADLTLAAVRSLLEQVEEAHGRALVIDDASSDQDLAILQRDLPPSVGLLRLVVNRGYAAACNLACQIASGLEIPYVWLLNNDLLFEPDVLSALLKVADTDDQIAAVAPVTVDAARGRSVLGAGADVDLWRGRVRHRFQGRPVDDLPSEPFDVGAVEGSSLLLRAAALPSIGLLDELFFMYWEDIEWSQRAVRSGFRLVVVPTARVRHLVSRSSSPLTRDELMMRNRVRFMRLRGSAGQQLIFISYYLGLWLPAYLGARLIPRFGLRRGWAAARDALLWNVADARRRGHWRLLRRDQGIPDVASADGAISGTLVIAPPTVAAASTQNRA